MTDPTIQKLREAIGKITMPKTTVYSLQPGKPPLIEDLVDTSLADQIIHLFLQTHNASLDEIEKKTLEVRYTESAIGETIKVVPLNHIKSKKWEEE